MVQGCFHCCTVLKKRTLWRHCLVALGHAHLLHSPDHLAEVRGQTFGALAPGPLVLPLGHSCGRQHQERRQSLQASRLMGTL